MRFIKPIILRESHYRETEKDILKLLFDTIIRPVVAAVKLSRIDIHNARDPLFDAIVSGKIVYFDGFFSGDFTAATSKQLKEIGARFNHLRRGWALKEALPAQYQMAVAHAVARYNQTVSDIVDALDSTNTNRIAEDSTVTKSLCDSTTSLNDDFEKTVRSISIPPKLTIEARQLIAQNWGDNLKLDIKKFADEQVLELRQKVTRNTISGGRAESLQKMIMQTYNTTKAKAKFLARQETSLLMAQLREQRYAEVGIQRYKWSGADDERERPDHKLLNGKIFSFDQPPITNRATGARNNPGQDYGCRCIAIPIVEGDEG